MKNKTLILEIPYGGLGDHLFHSPIPRIAKELKLYDKVFVSKKSLFRHPDNLKLVWEINPFVDGFTDEKGMSCNINEILKKIENTNTSKTNLIDEILLSFGLNDNKYWHEPEVYYKPKFKEIYNKTIYDPNFLSWVGEVNKRDIMTFFRKNKLKFDAIMDIRTPNALYKARKNDWFLKTDSLFDFCDLIYSAKQLYCLTSGTATLASALNKKCTVFYGENQNDAFRHSKLHDYKLVKKNNTTIFFEKIKSIINVK